ncbi:hypothetical protein SEPCBS119000_004737 [Sporothrix epigloea]|uniref:Spo12-like protein n=1 Tax=Sporothrix epigloea TaxID=1892477 RepID=A0ABP0DVP1_9PEZI
MDSAPAPASKLVLGDKDVNTAITAGTVTIKDSNKDIKSMEYHRNVLQSKVEADGPKQYISPSDNIMSPCTAKLKALRTKQAGKAKPKSLFAQASARKMMGGSSSSSPFGSE